MFETTQDIWPRRGLGLTVSFCRVNDVFLLQMSLAATVQIQQRQRTAEKVRVDELDGVRELLQRHVREVALTNKVSDYKVLHLICLPVVSNYI